jgi:hypothetical protein
VEVHEYVGLYELRVYDIEQALVKTEFLFGQVHACKQQAFGEQVIGYGNRLEKVFRMYQFLQLFVPFGHEKQFERKSVLFGTFVKFWQEGIVGEFFQHQPRIEMFAQQVCQRGFARADIAFNRNKVIIHI